MGGGERGEEMEVERAGKGGGSGGGECGVW